MKYFLAVLPLILMGNALIAVGEESVPGYRGSYPQNAYGASNFTTVPKKTSRGRFSYSDTNLLFNPSIHKSDHTELCVLLGVRDLYVKLKDHLTPQNHGYGVVGINGIYTGIEKWDWTAGLSLQGGTQNFSFRTNTRYIGALLGRYQQTDRLGISVGAYAEVFSRANIVQPALGLDYTYANWTAEAIFPVKIGLVYKKYKNNIFSLVGKPIYTAFESRKGFGKKRAISSLSGYGAEVRYDYLGCSKGNLWIALGETIQTRLKVGNKHYKHKHHINIPHTPYINVGIVISF